MCDKHRLERLSLITQLHLQPDQDVCTTLIEHDKRLTMDTPVRVKQYPLLFRTMETINGEIKEMIDLDIVESSDSRYCSRVLSVKKKDNSNRFCINFRALN